MKQSKRQTLHSVPASRESIRGVGLPTEDTASVPIIRRKSVLQHLETDLLNLETKTFLYRLTTIGSHEEVLEDLENYMEKLVLKINGTCYDEPLTGIFVIYPKHFVQVVEGSEDTINKYIAAVSEEFEGNPIAQIPAQSKIKQIKMRIMNMNRVQVVQSLRTTDRWVTITRNESGDDDVLKKVRGYRNRVYEFIKSSWIMSAVLIVFMEVDEISPRQDPTDFNNPEDQLLLLKSEQSIQAEVEQEIRKYCPTIETLAYFMKPKPRLPPLRSPKEHMSHSWGLPKIIFDSETAWPIPSRLASYD